VIIVQEHLLSLVVVNFHSSILLTFGRKQKLLWRMQQWLPKHR